MRSGSSASKKSAQAPSGSTRRSSLTLGRRNSAFQKTGFDDWVQNSIDANVRLQGWMSKRTSGVSSRAVKRYFVVEGPYLKYYEDETKGVVKGCIYLTETKMVAYKGGCQIKLTIPSTKTDALMIAKDVTSTSEWISAIKNAMTTDALLQDTMDELGVPEQDFEMLRNALYRRNLADFAGVSQVSDLNADTIDSVKNHFKLRLCELWQSQSSTSGTTNPIDIPWQTNPMPSPVASTELQLQRQAQTQAQAFIALAKAHAYRKGIPYTQVTDATSPIVGDQNARLAELYMLQRKISEKLGTQQDFNKPLQDGGTLNRRDTFKVGTLGEGAFGSIALITHAGVKYACKQLLQTDLMEMDDEAADSMQAQFDNERLLLSQVHHPFILSLLYTISADEGEDAADDQPTSLGGGSALVLEWMPGGDLGDSLKRARKENGCVCGLGVDAVHFYSASMVLAIEFLHSKHIIHRDIKPENMLMTVDGFVKLADFGFAKQLSSEDEKAFTFLGSPLYMAPEGIIKSGTGPGGDIWALAVTIYELCTGKCLFDNPSKSGDLAQIFLLVLTSKSKGPPFLSGFAESSPGLEDLLLHMLKFDPLQRCSAAEVKSFPYFQDVEWQELFNKKVQAPFLPNLSLDKGGD